MGLDVNFLKLGNNYLIRLTIKVIFKLSRHKIVVKTIFTEVIIQKCYCISLIYFSNILNYCLDKIFIPFPIFCLSNLVLFCAK